jgi:hypothetical protein
MPNIYETAIELHRELSRRGLELNPKIGRDAALHATLASKLGLSADGFSRALKHSSISSEAYLRALMEVAQPFAQMFQQIWSYLSKHCAPRANESLYVRFGFDNERTEIDWDQFRVMVESARKVWAIGPIVMWPLNELFGLARLLSEHDPNWRSIPGSYERGKPFTLPEIQVIDRFDEVGHRVREAMQSWIDAIHHAWPLERRIDRDLPELDRTMETNPEHEREQELIHLSYALTDLLPTWKSILGNWDLIPPRTKQKALDYFDQEIAPKLQPNIGGAWRSALEALDILDLPFWRHRWHTYEVWSAIKALEALDDFHPLPIVSGGHIALDVASPALVAKLAASQTVYAHVQAETKLLHPLGNRKAIKPDLRFSIDTPATNGGTIAIIEFKQRRELDVAHVSEVLAAYSLGVGLRGGVVLINYDAAPAVEVPLGCIVIGDVHPGKPDKVREYQTAVRNCFTGTAVVPQPRRRFVLLDVSGSMGLAYTSPAAQRGLKRLVALPWVKVFRFNDGLVPGGDLKADSQIATGGNTELGAALKQLFELPDAGIPERLVIVTDGGHDHPDELLAKVGLHVECKPDDLEEHLDWLAGH